MTESLDLTEDPVELTAALVDIPSVSGAEERIADAVERALRAQAPWLEVTRSGQTVLARTHFGRAQRIVLAGHLDTVPINDNLPSHRSGSAADELVHGCGTTDMKSGDAVLLRLAAELSDPGYDLTFVFYDCEEVEAERNGLNRIERDLPDWLDGDLAVVCEPSNAVVEAGCQGTMRVRVRASGERAHTARAWMGSNAIHGIQPVLDRLNEYVPREPEVDGLGFHEGLQAVHVEGGVAGNVVPDSCVVTVNHRFAPDRSVSAAEAHVRAVFAGFEVEVEDAAAPARPGIAEDPAAALVRASGADPVAKLGWTDVARFAARGQPAVNFGPGDPTLAHTQQEHVAAAHIRHCTEVLRRFLAR